MPTNPTRSGLTPEHAVESPSVEQKYGSQSGDATMTATRKQSPPERALRRAPTTSSRDYPARGGGGLGGCFPRSHQRRTSLRVLVRVHLGPAEVLGLAFMVLVVTAIVRTIKR
jgi:hypothetical protein